LELARDWNTVFGRLGYSKWSVAIEEISRANSITRDDMISVLSTAACDGGLGLFDCSGVEGLAVSKQVRTHNFTLTKIPDIAIKLSAKWPIVTAETLTNIWIKAIEPPKNTSYEVKPFVLTRVNHTTGLTNISLALTDITRTMIQPRFRADIPPSIIDGIKLGINKEHLSTIEQYLDISSILTFALLSRHASRSVLYLWLRDKLPFKTPVVNMISSSYTGHIHKLYWRSAWNWVLTRKKITMNLVRKSARTVETYTKRYLTESMNKVWIAG